MTRPLWVDPSETRFPVLDGDIQVDLAVVGGGFSGVGAAWEASERGARVALLEARTIAGGASGRNAGFVLAGPAMGFRASAQLVGVEQTLDIWRLTQENHSLISTLADELDADCGYMRRGSMSLAASEAEWAELEVECGEMAAAGLDVCLVPARDLPRPFDAPYFGGIYHAGNGEIDPGAFLRSLTARLSGKVQIFEETPVHSFSGPSEVIVKTKSGRVLAQRAVVATNAYTAALIPALPIAPTRGQVVSTPPAGRVIVPFPMYANRGYQYWKQTPIGQIVAGGWRNLAVDEETGTEERLHPGIQATLDGFLAQLAPDAPVEYRWAGIMGFTPDHFPLVGPVPDRPGLYVAAGYSGHGVAMAFICGSLAAREALGAPSAIPAAFSPGRFSRAA